MSGLAQGPPFRLRWQHIRCTPNSCIPITAPNSAALGHFPDLSGSAAPQPLVPTFGAVRSVDFRTAYASHALLRSIGRVGGGGYLGRKGGVSHGWGFRYRESYRSGNGQRG